MNRSHAWILPLVLAAGCVTTEAEKPKPIDQKTLNQHLERLRRPFMQGHTVYCRTLDIEVNAAIHREVTCPAGGKRSTGDGFDQITWNRGDRVDVERPKNAVPLTEEEKKQQQQSAASQTEPIAQKFRVMIGTTAFQVDDAVRIKKLLRAPPTLTATASGRVVVVQSASSAEKFDSVRYADGQVHTKAASR